MNHTSDTTAANGGNFDPRQAAALLDQTTQQARRQLEPSPPWLLTIRAFMALAILRRGLALGARTASLQSPDCRGYPRSGCACGRQPGCDGHGCQARDRWRAREIPGAPGRDRRHGVVWVGVFVALGALAGAGVSHSIIYGIYPVDCAADRRRAGLGGHHGGTGKLAQVRRRARRRLAVGVVGVFAGPAGAWAVAGVGLFLSSSATAAVIAWQQRRSVVGP